MNYDRKKTLIAIATSYVIKKRRNRLLEKEIKNEENINIGYVMFLKTKKAVNIIHDLKHYA